MAMSAGNKGEDAPMSEINTTPLVDIMLVLLIIFLITVPVVLETVNLKLPDVQFEVTTTKPENVLLSVRSADTDGDGEPNPESPSCEVYWGQTPVDSKQLLERGQEKLKQLLEDIGGPRLRSAANGSIFQQPLLVDGTDSATIPNIAQMPFLPTIRQPPGPEHSGTFAAGIADAFIDNPV